MADAATLLAMHSSLPQPRQPAWGVDDGQGAVKRAHDERLGIVLPLLLALPRERVLRILDVDCAQGYFTLAITHALMERGCAVEMVGVDRSGENVRFCEALASHHGVPVRFVCAAFDAEFVDRQEHAHWDAVLVRGNSIVAEDADKEEAGVPISLLRAHSRITLCETPEDPQSSGWRAAIRGVDDRLPSAHAFSRRLASAHRVPDAGTGNIYACSDHLAWVGDRWFAFDQVTDRSHPGVPDSFAGQRRFFLGVDAVIKAFRGDGRHGAFNRAELAAEAEVLQALQGEPGRYPAVLAQADDGDVVWLARESLPGELLSDRMVSGGIDRDAVARGLLGELAHLESRGFHHADLRCWNVLLDGGNVRLIDFGALVRAPSALQRLALSAVLLEMANGQADHEQPFYASMQPVKAYPTEWQPLLRYVLGTTQSTFRYEEARRILESSLGTPTRNPTAGVGLELDAELMATAAQEHCEAFRRLREHDEAMERALDGAERAHAAEIAEVRSLRVRVHELVQAREVAEREHVKHAASLKGDLEKSQAYATSLETRLDREAADVRHEREAMEAAQRAATSYSDSLKQSLDKSREYADSLRDSLGHSQAYASSLEARIARESADAQREREALQAAQRDASTHAEALQAAQRDASAHAEALQAAERDASARAEALGRKLDATQMKADELRHDLAAARAEHARMQRRFRLLKFLWPRGSVGPKEP